MIKITYSLEKEVIAPNGAPVIAEVFWNVVVPEEMVNLAIDKLKESDRNVLALSEPDDGCCPHGNYIGGCGIDWMCTRCEMALDGDDDYDFAIGLQEALGV